MIKKKKKDYPEMVIPKEVLEAQYRWQREQQGKPRTRVVMPEKYEVIWREIRDAFKDMPPIPW